MSLQELAVLDTDMQQPLSRALSNAFKGASKDSDSFIWVSPDGDDANGDGSLLTPYATIAAALAAVTSARKNILILQGTYVEAATLIWPDITGISLAGVGGEAIITVVSTETDAVISINPTFSASTFEAFVTNLTITAPNGVDGIKFDNENTTDKKYNLYLRNVTLNNDTNTDKSLYVIHTTAGQAMRVYADGMGNLWEGLLSVAPKNTGDRFMFSDIQFDGGVAFGTATIASLSVFKNCIMKDAGGSGGQDDQILISIGCVSLTGTTYAVAALNDFATAALETIFSLTT